AKRLLSPEIGPLWATLEELEPPAAEARATLTALSELPLATDAAPGVTRRVVRLRCAAAGLLAGRASASRRLLACDPDPEGEIGLLARLRALDRGPLTGARLRFWQRLTESNRPPVRQAALRLLGSHAEVRGAHEVLAKALLSEQTGTVATAAQVLAAYPDRAAAAGRGESRASAPHPSIIAAFGKTLERAAPVPPVEAL